MTAATGERGAAALLGAKDSLGVRETSTRVVLHTVDGFPRGAAV